jgi:excisionase family DNA binding protein
MSEETYLKKSEVAARLRKQPRTIERWMREGIIPFLKIGKGRRATVLFKWPDVESSLKARFGVGGAA